MLSRLYKTLHQRPIQPTILIGWVLFGVVLRLRQYLAGRSLWLDEAMLALNLVGRDFAGLFQSLDYNQGGPVGFLLLEKLVITLLGNNELTLRLIPFLTGCAALLFFALLVRRMLGNFGLFLALGLMAAAAPLIYYSSEVKQYSSDVFVTVFLLWLTCETLSVGQNLHHEGTQRRTNEHAENHQGTSFVFLRALRGHKVFLAVAGALALWFSHPALFTLMGVGAALLLQPGIWKDRARLQPVLLVISTWVVSFGVLYLVSLRGLAANAYLLDYWAEYFMPLPPWKNWGWFPSTGISMVEFIFAGLPNWAASIGAVLVVGLMALLRRNLQFGVLLSLPVLTVLIASALGKYPFAGRMILFAAPLFIALTAAGVETVIGWLQRQRWLALLIGLSWAVVLLYPSITGAAENFVQPKYPEHIRPTMAYLQQNRKPGDTIYVYFWAVPAFRYYAPFYNFTESDIVAGNDYTTQPPGLLTEADQFKGRKRIWVLFSHVYEKGGYNEKDALLAHLNDIGDQKREFHVPGTSVNLYLYDLAGP